MVCISCIVIPVVLYIWHKFLQPFVLKFWNPWGKVEDKSEETSAKELNLTCPMSKKSNEAPAETDSSKEVLVNGKGKVD